MAQRRMTSLDIVDTDAFVEMPQSSQLLYFHLNARADDDGFVSSPRKIARMIGSNSDDLKILASKKFIIVFEDGVCVIKHWRINNFIRKDIYKETKYLDLKQTLLIRSNGSYTLNDDGRAVKVPSGFYNLEYVDDTLTQRQPRIGKVRIGKDREDKIENSVSFLKEIPEETISELKEKGYTKTQIISKAEDLYLYCESKGKKYKNYKAFLLNALKKDFGEDAKRNRVLSPTPTTPTVEITSEQQAEIDKKKEEISKMFKR